MLVFFCCLVFRSVRHPNAELKLSSIYIMTIVQLFSSPCKRHRPRSDASNESNPHPTPSPATKQTQTSYVDRDLSFASWGKPCASDPFRRASDSRTCVGPSPRIAARFLPEPVNQWALKQVRTLNSNWPVFLAGHVRVWEKSMYSFGCNVYTQATVDCWKKLLSQLDFIWLITFVAAASMSQLFVILNAGKQRTPTIHTLL